MEFDLVDYWDDGCVFQEPLKVAHAPVGNLNCLDFVEVLLVDLLNSFVDIQPVEIPVGLFILQDLISDIPSLRHIPRRAHILWSKV